MIWLIHTISVAVVKKLKQKPSYLYKDTYPRVSDDYFFDQKVRGDSLRLDLYVYEWKHILCRDKVTFEVLHK